MFASVEPEATASLPGGPMLMPRYRWMSIADWTIGCERAAVSWLSVAAASVIKTAIEAAAAQHLPGFDAAAFWKAWRVDLP